MKLLFVLRLYSGFERSISEGLWAPSGAPTISRLLAGLAEDGHEISILFTKKGQTAVALPEDPAFRRISGLKAQLRVLERFRKSGPIPLRLLPYVTEFRQAVRVLQTVRRLDPDLIYVDRGNVLSAGIAARWSRKPVVLRVMGVTPALVDAIHGRRPADRLMRWCWRAPFAAAICTQDGSGGELWLTKLLRSSVPRYFLLNGVDEMVAPSPASGAKTTQKSSLTVLFVGRLEELKGAGEFVNAFLLARSAATQDLNAMIVGNGSLESRLREVVAHAGAQKAVTFLGNVPHSEMHRIYRAADIYVSLNRQGNLSNSNLEAFRAGVCSIVPASSPALGRDVYLDELMSDDTLFRVPSVDTHAVAEAIVHLAANDRERRDRGRQTAERAATILGSWSDRVSEEAAILSGLAARP